jgi:hypothetical protein
MANTDQWILQTAYTDTLIASGFTGLGVGSWAKGGTAITAGLLDQYGRWSFSFVLSGNTVAGDYLALYGLPVNQDGTTYGDNTAAGSALPSSTYLLGTCFVAAGVSTIVGNIPFYMPERSFIFGVANRTSVAFHATTPVPVTKYATFRDNLNA